MSIAIGDRLPEGRLSEFYDVETATCSLGPNNFQVSDLTKGKKIVIFGVPAAFSPTCSDDHLPGFVKLADKFKAKGVDEIWCVAVNDAFVMGAWGRAKNTAGKIRMMADGSAAFTKALGVELDLTKAGMGVRSSRYSMYVEDGVVKKLNLEKGGKLEISGADKLLEQI
jgi:glutaredoxin/glutathione-dependent peroxiredoxin